MTIQSLYRWMVIIIMKKLICLEWSASILIFRNLFLIKEKKEHGLFRMVKQYGVSSKSNISIICSWEKNDLSIEKNVGEPKQIIFNNVNQKKVKDGINILVYDNFTNMFVESVGFNAEGNYNCIK